MSDRQVYERARAEMQRCEERVEELRAFLRTYDELAATTPPIAERQQVDANTPSSKEWEQVALAAMRDVGRPMRVGEIYQVLVAHGLGIESARPTDVLNTRIGRSESFRRASRGLYEPADRLSSSPQTAVPATADIAPSAGIADDDAEETPQSVKTGGSGSEDFPGHLWEQAAKGA